MKRVGIVVCNYNKVDKVLECIQCIREQKFTDYDIYVVDNASMDGSARAIRENYGDVVTLIENAENLGGSGGFNTGLRKAYEMGYEYLMCVDNDAMLDENAVGNLVEFLDAHSEVGMAASKIYHLEKPDYIQQFGQKIDFWYFCTEVPHLNMVEDGSMPDFLYVDSVAACSLMVRKSTIGKIGFMPEENFLYWDDTEWCYLCNRAGMKVASVGTSKALHAMGAKKEDVNTFPTYYAWRNWIRFFSKYTPKADLERMARTFLNSVFEVVYIGIHKGEYNKGRTVMLAYDDAIHGVMGKAGDNRIFEIDFNEEPFRRLFASGKSFCIEGGDKFPTLAGWLKSLAGRLGASGGECRWVSAGECDSSTVVLRLCENVLRITDLSEVAGAENVFDIQSEFFKGRTYGGVRLAGVVYVDIDHCVVQNEKDVRSVAEFEACRKSFIAAELPVFLQKLEEI